METAEDILRSQPRQLITVTPETTIRDTLQVMTRAGIGSILVLDKEKLVGIWTERDLLHNTLSPQFDPATSRIEDFMVRDLVYTPHTDTVYELIDKILGRRHRRLLIERNGEFIGLLTVGDVLRAFMQAKQRELEAINAMVGWEYYEEWRWTRESGKIDKPETRVFIT